MIKNYIFDFDGTLADSSIGIYKAFSSTCIKNNLKPPEINAFKKHIGPPIYRLIYSIYPNITDSQKNTFVKTFRVNTIIIFINMLIGMRVSLR